MKYPHEAEREHWILKYMSTSPYTDILNEDFHDAYYKAFPVYKRRETRFGAQPVAQAMRDLARMARAGILESGRVGVSGGEGFPTSVVGYSLPEIRRRDSAVRNG